MGLRYNRDLDLLHKIIGVALLDDDLCQKLLRQSARKDVLNRWRLSQRALDSLERLPDQPCLEALAAYLYNSFFSDEKLQ